MHFYIVEVEEVFVKVEPLGAEVDLVTSPVREEQMQLTELYFYNKSRSPARARRRADGRPAPM